MSPSTVILLNAVLDSAVFAGLAVLLLHPFHRETETAVVPSISRYEELRRAA
ncbi:MAG TPA: hypothetical protein VMU73_02210 [Gaiellaceae bacterium]|nr:hypothetical protein [Gaiellaceae bacterium]